MGDPLAAPGLGPGAEGVAAKPSLCRDCLTESRADTADPARRCAACGSPRLLAHPELHDLFIAHLDADAFYASVEKRDDPSLLHRPVIVGGGSRGVVTTACYIARTFGVRSAMPMFKALKLCPEAAVIRPRMAHYVAISRQIRALLDELTPAVEPLSLDEAFLDLAGTERLHRATPAAILARLQQRIEREIGLTVSIGLSHAKYLAKIASDANKPRGFTVIGRAETADALAALPLSALPGVGPTTAAALARTGLRTVADARALGRDALLRAHGELGLRLHQFSHGQDSRSVRPGRAIKSISHETTFNQDLADPAALKPHLWRLAEKVAARAKERGLAGHTVTLKLKRADHRLLTRRQSLAEPTQLADRLYRTAAPLLRRDLGAGPFRLIGVGLSTLVAAAPESGDLADPAAARRDAAERAADAIRARWGAGAIMLGRALE
jgi:DNA polymerase IV